MVSMVIYINLSSIRPSISVIKKKVASAISHSYFPMEYSSSNIIYDFVNISRAANILSNVISYVF